MLFWIWLLVLLLHPVLAIVWKELRLLSFSKLFVLLVFPTLPKSKSPLPSHTKSHLPIYSYSFDFLLLQCGFGRSVAPIKAGSVGCVGRRNTRKWSAPLSFSKFKTHGLLVHESIVESFFFPEDGNLDVHLPKFSNIFTNQPFILCRNQNLYLFPWEFGCGDEFIYYLSLLYQLFLYSVK